jgi:hypothetical protein
MDQAERRLSQSKDGITTAAAAPMWMLKTLANQQAKARVRNELKRQGYKISSTTAAEITEMTRDYLSQHHDELFARAEEIVAGSVELQKMARRWEREEARAAVRKGMRNRTLASDQPRNVEASRR